jgi:hypothetical protein
MVCLVQINPKRGALWVGSERGFAKALHKETHTLKMRPTTGGTQFGIGQDIALHIPA